VCSVPIGAIPADGVIVDDGETFTVARQLDVTALVRTAAGAEIPVPKQTMVQYDGPIHELRTESTMDGGESLDFTPQNFPPGTYAMGGASIHRVHKWEGTALVQFDSWTTTDPAQVNPELPDVRGDLMEAPKSMITRIPKKLIGSDAKAEDAKVSEDAVGTFLSEIEAALSSTPQTALEIVAGCPSFGELAKDKAAHRVTGFLSSLKKQGRVVLLDDGQWTLPVAPPTDEEAEDVPATPNEGSCEICNGLDHHKADCAYQGKEAAPIDLEGPVSPDVQPVPNAKLARDIEELAQYYGLSIDVDAFNPTWLMKDDDVVDDSIAAATAALLRGVVARRGNDPRATDVRRILLTAVFGLEKIVPPL